MTRGRGPRRGGRAFTLVEILVVIVIIGILVAVAMTLANRVTQGGRASLTEQTIRVLETAVQSYVSDKQEKFPAFYLNENQWYFAIVDGRWTSRQLSPSNMRFDKAVDWAQPTGALAVSVLSQSTTGDAAVKQIDAKLVKRYGSGNAPPLQAWGWPLGGTRPGSPPGGPFGNHPTARAITAVVVNDAWGNPLRMVHPAFDGGHGAYFDSVSQTMATRPDLTVVPQRPSGMASMHNIIFTRSYKPFDPTTSSEGTRVGDADEGICPGGTRPYFYSVGADGDPGTRGDNVYTERPEFPEEVKRQVE